MTLAPLSSRQRRGGMLAGTLAYEFEYMIDLPSDIDSDQVQAAYSNGVLTVTVPKARNAHPRRIEIQAQGDQQGRQRLSQQQPGQSATGQQQGTQRSGSQQSGGPQRGGQNPGRRS